MILNNRKIGASIFLIGALFLIAIIIFLFTDLSFLPSLRIVFGTFYILFLPGYVLTYVFFSGKENQKIDLIERILLSLALSMAVVPLFLFLVDKIGVKINLLSSSAAVLGIILLGLIILYFRNKKLSK